MSEDLKSYTKGRNFTARPQEDGIWTAEKVTLSCMLRIADSAEAMAKNVTELQYSLDFYKEQSQKWRERYEITERSNIALRGHNTRLRNKLKKANNGTISKDNIH